MTKYSVGDRVEVTIVADVTDGDGNYLTLNDGDIRLWAGTRGVQIRKLPPPKPGVGEIISGERLKATPWKRGTVIKSTIDDDEGVSSWRYLLTADGRWTEDSGEVLTFEDVATCDNLEVAYLP